MAIKTTNMILIQLNPTTELSSLFIIPALRHIVDIFESEFQFSEEEKELIEFIHKELGKTKTFEFEVEES